ncbi:MAG: DNA polymerase I, partial [Elainellaceae cyanobacterium]
MATASSDQTPLLILVDGHSLAFRSYFAHSRGPDGGLRTSTGIPTSVSYGFLRSLFDMLQAEAPTHVAVAFDMGAPTFRHEADKDYKAGRPDAPEDFLPDLKNLQAVLATLNITMLAAEGYEADDIIGTLTRLGSQAGYRVKILSGDRDLFQLVDDDKGVSVLYLSSTFGPRASAGAMEIQEQQVVEKLGIAPSQVVDYKALCGDSSDNIPGVKGVGAKTAVKLLHQFGTLEALYNSLDEIKGAARKRLEAGQDLARHSQYLAQIHLNVPIDAAVEQCKLETFESSQLTPLLEKLELRQFLKSIPRLQQIFAGQAVEEAQPAEVGEALLAAPADEETWFYSAADTEASDAVQSAAIAPQVIDTPQALEALLTTLKTCTDPKAPVAWDTETTALEPRDAKLVGLGCCWGTDPDAIAYIPLHHQEGRCLPLADVLEILRPVLESADYPKVLQNAKFDRLILRAQGVDLAGVVFDPMLASYVLNPDASHNLTDLALRYLNMSTQSYSDIVPKGKTIDCLSVEKVAQYCGEDAYITFLLVDPLRQELATVPDLQQLLETVELPLEPVLAEMEYCGILIDTAYLKGLSTTLGKDLAALEQQAYQDAGTEFNLGSPKQLSELLFDTLGLDKRKSRKTKTGYSTDAATLEKLQGDHPVIDAMIEYRTLSKLKSTYVDALPDLVRADTGRIHTDFNQAITTTGRLSSSNPNLQNIPIRTEFSRKIRAAFVPQPGWQLVAADYSQIELRILAHLSQEPVLINAYQNNDDVHRLTARLLFERNEITADERRLGKIINFGVIYGMGAVRFAREAGVSRDEARRFIERFNERYPQVFTYLQRMQQEAIAQGYVTTIQGRRRYFHFTSSKLKSLRG